MKSSLARPPRGLLRLAAPAAAGARTSTMGGDRGSRIWSALAEPARAGAERRMRWLQVVIALGFASGLLLSAKMWVSTRVFPLTPVWDALPSPPFPVDYILLGALLGLLVPIAVLPRPRAFIVAFLVVLGVLALLDQQRWQPWSYQYAFMLAAIALYGRRNGADRREAALDACRIIVVGIYFWSGLNKTNAAFIEDTWPWLTGPLLELLPGAVAPAVGALGYVAPFLELSLAIGLLTPRFRRLAVVGAVTMQVFILLCIGPWALDFNSVVWPWNLTMVAAVPLLFWNHRGTPLRNVLTRHAPFGKLVLILFLVMPAFAVINLWDSFLSASLYTGNTKRAYVLTDDAARARVSPELATWFEPEGPNQIRVIGWAFDELNAPVFPEDRVFESAARAVCRDAGPDGVALVIQNKLENRLVNRKPLTRLTCAEL